MALLVVFGRWTAFSPVAELVKSFGFLRRFESLDDFHYQINYA